MVCVHSIRAFPELLVDIYYKPLAMFKTKIIDVQLQNILQLLLISSKSLAILSKDYELVYGYSMLQHCSDTKANNYILYCDALKQSYW